jgi:hypothetical protein
MPCLPQLFRRIIDGDERPPERSAMSLAKKAGRELVAQIVITRTEQLFEQLGLCKIAWMLETLVQRNCGVSRRVCMCMYACVSVWARVHVDDVYTPTPLCPQDYVAPTKGGGRSKSAGIDIGAMVKLFEEDISGMLGGIKVTCVSSKIDGINPTEEELIKVQTPRCPLLHVCV